MQKILVSGGGGYIGSHMVYALLENGFEPIILDSFERCTDQNLKTIEKIKNVKLKIYKADLKTDNLTKIIEEKDIYAITHFAAYKAVGESVEIPLDYYINNVYGTTKLLEFAKNKNIKKFVFSSTGAVYGNNPNSPLNEESETMPESPYAASKLFAERIIKDFSAVNDFKAVALRYFNVAGNITSGKIGDTQITSQSLLPSLIMSHLGIRKIEFKIHGNDYNTTDGTAIRDYIHVVDLVDAHIKALEYMEKSQINFDIFNLGTGKGSSVLEVIKSFEEVTNTKLDYEFGPRRAGDVESQYCNPNKAFKLLNWKAKYNLNNMLESSYIWYKNNFKSLEKKNIV